MKRALSLIICSIYLINLNPFIYAAGTGEQGGWNKGAYAKAAEEQSESVLIKALEGGFVELGGARIDIPSGALAKDTQISIKRLVRTEETGDGLYNVTSGGGAYRFEPAGLQFLKEVQISIAYTSILEGKDASLEDTYTYFYDVKQKKWVALRRLSIEKEKRVIHSATTHFTDMINATLALPENPSSLDFNLNSIKGLEAANANAQVAQIDGLQADSFGDASFQLKLDIPQGRGSMMPQILLGYSSGGENGIVGRGFNIQYGGSIAIDTRWGVPLYDSTCDRYTKDGVLLEEIGRTDSVIHYQEMRKTVYRTIERIQTEEEDYWLVKENDGKKKFYGKAVSSWAGENEKSKNIWYLDREVDLYGNTVQYIYKKDEGFVYPKYIYYTGKEGILGIEKGVYCVEFSYEGREDERLDLRGGYKRRCAKRLKAVSSYYKYESTSNDDLESVADNGLQTDKIIKQYRFSYTHDRRAKTSMLNCFSVYGIKGQEKAYEYKFEYEDIAEGEDEFERQKKWGQQEAIQVKQGVSAGISGAISGGVGYGIDYIDARVSGGLQGSFSKGKNYSSWMLFDINGDGRPDSIYIRKKLHVRLNTGNNFAEEQVYELSDIGITERMRRPEFEQEESTTDGKNGYVGLGVPIGHIAAGVTKAETTNYSDTQVMHAFMDVDGDHLVDIIETGKTYYYKNVSDMSGSPRFVKTDLAVDVEMKDLYRILTDEQRENYGRQYYIQSPFRAWKAPFAGAIRIAQQIQVADEEKISSDGIQARIYVGGAKESSFEQTLSKEQSNYHGAYEQKVSTDSYVYFVPDPGEKCRIDDIDWNIGIKYTNVEPYNTKTDYLALFVPDEPITEKTIQYTKQGTGAKLEDSDKMAILAKYGITDKEFLNAYQFYIDMQSENSLAHTTNFALHIGFIGWPKMDTSSRRELINTLVSKNMFVPTVFTKEQFELLVEQIKLDTNKKDKNLALLHAYYIYEAGNGVYRLIQTDKMGISDYKILRNIIPSEYIRQAVNNYKVNGVLPVWDYRITEYQKELKVADLGNRIREKEGGIFNDGSCIYIGLFEGKNSSIVKKGEQYILYKEGEADNKEGRRVYAQDDFSKILIEEDGYRAEYYFEEISKKADRIEKKELDSLQKDSRFKIAGNNIDDIYWQEVQDFTIDQLQVKLTESIADEQDRIYILTKAFDEQKKEEEDILLYTRRLHIEANIKEQINDILLKNARDKVLENRFPFYEADNTGYVLKEEYKTEKEISWNDATSKSLRDEELSQKNDEQLRILYTAFLNKASLSEIKTVLKDECGWTEDKITAVFGDNQTYKEISKGNKTIVENSFYDLYKTLREHSLIRTICKEYHWQKYDQVNKKIIYKKNGCYEVDENNEYEYLDLQEGYDGYGIFNWEKKSIETWNSKQDFSSENKVIGYNLGPVKRSLPDGASTNIATDDVPLYMRTDEVLYGGVRNWYYGIWVGRQTLTADMPSEFKAYPFNESYLTKQKQIEHISKEEYEKRKQDTKIAQGDKEVSYDPFYIPTSMFYDDYFQNKKVSYLGNENYETESQRKFALEESPLLGRVSLKINQEFDEQEDATEIKNTTEYFAPYMIGDRIHINRFGADSYYGIRGIEDEPGKIKNIPNIRTITGYANEEIVGASLDVYGVNFSMKILEEKLHNISSIKDLSDIKDISAEIPGIIKGTKGTGTIRGALTFSMRDINGDGLADLIGTGRNKGVVSFAKKDKDGQICYNEAQDISIPILSRTENTQTVYGGAISCIGAITPKLNGNGKITGIALNGSTDSAGLSYTMGKSIQEADMCDINGDGLADYVSKDGILFGTGYKTISIPNGFDTAFINKSENSGIGISYSKRAGNLLKKLSGETDGNTGGADVSQSSSTRSLSGAEGTSLTYGLTYSASGSNTHSRFCDINGDGLPDIITKTGKKDTFKVRYNTGSSHLGEESALHIPDWEIDFLNNLAYAFTTDGNILMTALDNLPLVGNLIQQAEVLDEWGKTGVGVNPYGVILANMINMVDFTSSVNLGGNVSVNANANISIPIQIGPVYLGNVNLSAGGNAGFTVGTSLSGVSVQMIDMNGDGLPDHVMRIPQIGTYVKLNKMGKVGLLKQIQLPFGGRYEIEYEGQYGTNDMPQFKYVMSSIQKIDTLRNDSYKTLYRYYGGKYDRELKEFLGYATVKTLYADNSEQTVHYANTEYYSKGMTLRNELYDGKTGTVLFSEEQKLDNAPYARVIGKTATQFDGVSHIAKTETYTYDNYNNVTTVMEDSSQDRPLFASITYHEPITGVCMLAKEIRVYAGYSENGVLLRKRRARYYTSGEGKTAQLKELETYWNETDCLVTRFDYDIYGNMKTVRNPKNMYFYYHYDPDTHTYLQQISQQAGNIRYESNIDWDVKRGLKTAETDINGNIMRYEYDSFNRLIKVFGPYDNYPSGQAAVEYTYNTERRNSLYTITKNKISFDASDDGYILTVNELDGLGRTARTSKTGVVYKDGVKLNGWNVSGMVSYDGKGRIAEQYLNSFISGELQTLLDTPITIPSEGSEQAGLKTTYTYDSLDRIVKTILPDASIEYKSYGIDNNLFYNSITDPLGNISIQYSDVRGNIVAIERKDEHGKVLTKARYEYDVLGQLLTAYPADEKYPVSVTYDLLGRKTSLTSSDSGKKEYTYNNDGELAWETDSVLKTKGQRISYEYDEFSRIKKIDYPYSEDTVYEYGANGAPYNRAGKIVRIQDETGTIEYKYGKLGETTEEKRTIKHVNAFVHKESTTAVMSYVSDYLGRMQKIVYPDTEVIRYGYDEGGQVVSITGTYAGLVTEYVRDIGYDEYGQRVFIEYGNGVKTEYTYDKARRWLDTIRTQKDMETYQNIEYSFDKVGNVLGYKNDTTYYSTEQNYSYDGLYQLTEAQGTSINKPYGYVDYTSNYKQTFGFDSLGMGNMTAKISSVHNNPDRLLGENINYSLEYEYDEHFAHRVKRIGNRYYSYDENGNVVLEQDEPITTQDEQRYEIQELGENLYGVEYGWALENEEEQNKIGSSGVYKRRYRWNERNLMQESSENRQSVYYRYGADGQRALKSSNQSETLYFNTMWSRLHNSSAYNTERESKHIYLGSERLVTRTNGAGTQGNTYTAQVSTYYYHSDHLGSAQLITDNEGKEYERIEYTPYGEYWIEKRAPENKTLPFKFTGKERDEETGLYYYGARYLDPRTSRWLSADPALGDYIPVAPVNDEAKKHNENLPGMGGIYNTVNFHLYHYAGNNPVKYIDPTGRKIINTDVWYAKDFMQMFDATWPNSTETIARTGCTLIASNRVANVAINLFGCNMEVPNPSSIFFMLDDPSLTCSDGMIFSGLKNYLASYHVDATIIDTGKQGKDISKILEDVKFSEDSYLVIGRIPGATEDHYVNINSYNPSSKKVNATDTSISEIGQETRNLKSVDVSNFDRLILIKVKTMEIN